MEINIDDFKIETTRAGKYKNIKVTHIPTCEDLELELTNKDYNEQIVAEILMYLIARKIRKMKGKD